MPLPIAFTWKQSAKDFTLTILGRPISPPSSLHRAAPSPTCSASLPCPQRRRRRPPPLPGAPPPSPLPAAPPPSSPAPRRAPLPRPGARPRHAADPRPRPAPAFAPHPAARPRPSATFEAGRGSTSAPLFSSQQRSGIQVRALVLVGFVSLQGPAAAGLAPR
ncbi:anther-specific proline-rich protein APG-like [Sorghum bicolor]|uniref:anther-specific proline-rich protein APG-like n=1 Tax=Sorghum bicolor TaxID=4558 RepID=UPI000B424F93|nr:anther-specific proline-rich protein APG-like [Sorghum bicolor]|eukprot:XP_021318673.1 anther-specific proline-rich protein APG-like [Sorghum bicolor]